MIILLIVGLVSLAGSIACLRAADRIESQGPRPVVPALPEPDVAFLPVDSIDLDLWLIETFPGALDRMAQAA